MKRKGERTGGGGRRKREWFPLPFRPSADVPGIMPTELHGWVEAWGGGSCVSGSTRARKKGRKIEEN